MPKTTDRIRDLYVWAYAWRASDDHSETDLSLLRESNRTEFDEWLAEHDADLWQEGYDQGVNDEQISASNIGIAGLGGKIAPARANPYQKTAKQP